MNNSIIAIKKDMRQAGIFLLLHCIAIAYGVFYIAVNIGISGTAQSAGNVLLHEFLFRTGIVSRLLATVLPGMLALPLYRLFKNVNSLYATIMISCIIITIPLQFCGEGFNITSVMVAKGELLNSLSLQNRQDFVELFQNIYNNINSISQCFWGLWLFPFGLLLYKFEFAPKIPGVLMCVGAAGYFVDYGAFLFSPSLRAITVFALLIGFVSELIITFWFLLGGVKGNTIQQPRIRLI